MSESLHIVCPHCDTTNRVPRERLAESPTCGSCHAPLFDGHPVALTAANFDAHLTRNDVPVVVDFWADWCGPCKMMAPQFAAAAARVGPAARFAKLDTEAAQDIAARYGIRSIPTMIVFDHGREVERRSGAIDAGSIAAWVGSVASRAG